MVSSAGISMIAIGGIVGPLVSGVLVQHVGWQWCKIRLSSHSIRRKADHFHHQVFGCSYLQVVLPSSSCCCCTSQSRRRSPHCEKSFPNFTRSSILWAFVCSHQLVSCSSSPSTLADILCLELGNRHWFALRLRSHHRLVRWLVYLHARQRSHAAKYDEAKGLVDQLLHFGTSRWRNDNDGLLFARVVPGYQRR